MVEVCSCGIQTSSRVPYVRTNAVRTRASTDGHHVIVLWVFVTNTDPCFQKPTGPTSAAQGRKEGLDPTNAPWLSSDTCGGSQESRAGRTDTRLRARFVAEPPHQSPSRSWFACSFGSPEGLILIPGDCWDHHATSPQLVRGRWVSHSPGVGLSQIGFRRGKSGERTRKHPRS